MKWYDMQTLALKTGLKADLLWKYVAFFSEFFPSKSSGEDILYRQDCLELLQIVHVFLQEGLSWEEVREKLRVTPSKSVDFRPENLSSRPASFGATYGLSHLDPQGGQPSDLFWVMADQKKEFSRLRDDFSQLRVELHDERRERQALEKDNNKVRQALRVLHLGLKKVSWSTQKPKNLEERVQGIEEKLELIHKNHKHLEHYLRELEKFLLDKIKQSGKSR